MEIYKVPEEFLPENRYDVQHQLDQIIHATTVGEIDVETILDAVAQIGDAIKAERTLADIVISKLQQAGGRVDGLNQTLGNLMVQYGQVDSQKDDDKGQEKLSQEEVIDLMNLIR